MIISLTVEMSVTDENNIYSPFRFQNNKDELHFTCDNNQKMIVHCVQSAKDTFIKARIDKVWETNILGKKIREMEVQMTNTRVDSVL